ncbi:hypothetical protein [uncultured Ruminococcus sp.]|uniref:hypothetical protein n=1 Tax=uncultured Ruminococcus sp. TaxID=165186 RepID=UPI0025CF92C1|nr:hypothetical protein [uncultured Ruminococcus sp.]
MTKRIVFFATKNDMIRIFGIFYELLSFEIRIVRAGNMQNNSPNTMLSIEEIPHLGVLDSNTHRSENYIILKKDIPIVTKEINSKNHGTFYSIYDSMNETCISFSPSGFNCDGDCLIHGEVAIMNENDISKELMNSITKAIKKSCKNVRGWYIGHEAEQLNGKVRYITVSANEPQEFDFKF